MSNFLSKTNDCAKINLVWWAVPLSLNRLHTPSTLLLPSPTTGMCRNPQKPAPPQGAQFFFSHFLSLTSCVEAVSRCVSGCSITAQVWSSVAASWLFLFTRISVYKTHKHLFLHWHAQMLADVPALLMPTAMEWGFLNNTETLATSADHYGGEIGHIMWSKKSSDLGAEVSWTSKHIWVCTTL